MNFSDVENSGTCGAPIQILRGTRTELLRTNKTANAPGKPRLMNPCLQSEMKHRRETNNFAALRISNLISVLYISNTSQVTHAQLSSYSQHSCACFRWTWPHYVRETLFHPYAQLSHLWVDNCAATHAA